VYNRWGQEVFRTTDINGGWDGTFKGEELPSDAYAYYMRVICVNTLDYSKRGNVNLIR
jgi:gliding motility-associated-like protein